MGFLVFVLPLVFFASAFAGVLQSSDTCGVQNPKPKASGRLVGGSATLYGEFPWLVALHYMNSDSGRDGGVRCAGFLIADKFVLTAAHCLHLEGFYIDEVFLGVRRITEIETVDVDKVTKRKIEAALAHENYAAIGAINDIALLKLSEPVKYNDYIRPLCMPKADAALPASGTKLTIAGWGAVRSGSHLDSDLKLKVTIPIYDHETCREKIGKPIRADQFCAEGNNMEGSCWGDGGAPIMQSFSTSTETQWFAIGLVSGVNGCGQSGKPVLHTRVASYVNWVNQNMATM